MEEAKRCELKLPVKLKRTARIRCGGRVPIGAIASRNPVEEEKVPTPVRRSARIQGMKRKDYKEVSPEPKDYGDSEGPIRRPEGGSEWEPIKILLGGDRNSDKMISLGRTPKITRSALLPSVCQNHVATGVLLVLGTNSTSNLNTHAPTTAETTRKLAVQRGRLDRV
jgi:hypothetical protein